MNDLITQQREVLTALADMAQSDPSRARAFIARVRAEDDAGWFTALEANPVEATALRAQLGESAVPLHRPSTSLDLGTIGALMQKKIGSVPVWVAVLGLATAGAIVWARPKHRSAQ